MAAIVVLFILFAALAMAARTPGLLTVDEHVTHELQEHPSGPLDYVAFLFTTMGNAITMSLVCGVTALKLARSGQRRTALFVMATLLGLPLNMLLKVIIHRPRPTPELVRALFVEPGDSFPSGHAMASIIVYGFLAYLAWSHIADHAKRLRVTLSLAVLIFAIGCSRIYVGVHWFSDVAGAWLFGLGCLSALAQLHSGRSGQEPARPNAP